MLVAVTLRLSFFLLLLVSGPVALGQAYDLGPKYREGQSWTFKEIFEVDLQSETIPGGHQKLKSVHRTSWKVSKVHGDGNVDLVVEILSCEADAHSPGSEFFNFSKLVRQPIVLKMDSRGNVHDVIPPATLPEDAKASFDFYKQNYSRWPAEAFLPRGPVTMGEEWDSEGTITMELPIGDMDQIYQLKSKLEQMKTYEGRNCFEVSFEGNFTGTMRETEGSVEGTFGGKRLLDEESGMEIGARFQTHQSINILGPEGETQIDLDMTMSRDLDEEAAIQ